MARVDRFFQEKIPTPNARPGNVMVRARAISRKRRSPMVRLALQLDNVRRAIASTDIVATRRARKRAKLAAPPKKAAERMARVA